MRANMTVFIVLAVCALVAGAYFFIGKMKLDALVSEARAENEALTAQYDTITKHTQEIPVLAAQQGDWLESLEMFRDAIPNEVDDHVFFSNLQRELRERNVKLLGVQLGSGGTWMGKMRDAQAEQLEGIGVSVEAARQVKVAHYSLRLSGSYEDVLRVFENLKRYRRLYTIDQITSPTGGASGTITQAVDSKTTAMEVTGKIYYGIPTDFIDADALIEKIIKNLIGPSATAITRGVSGRGQELLNGTNPDDRTQLDRPAADLGIGENSAAAAEPEAPAAEKEPDAIDTKTGWNFVPGVSAAGTGQEQQASAGSAG